jgi:hypothetical protein
MPQDTSADQAARPEDVAGAQREGVLSIMATSEWAFGQVTGSQIQSLASDLTDAQLNLEAKRAEAVVAKTNIKSVQVEISSLAEKKRKLQHSIVAMRPMLKDTKAGSRIWLKRYRALLTRSSIPTKGTWSAPLPEILDTYCVRYSACSQRFIRY